MRALIPVLRSPMPPRFRRRGGATLVVAAIALWLAGITGGLAVLASYASTAPEIASAPDTWPAPSRLLREPGKVSVVVFIHPKCPCSSATLNELNRLMARSPGEHTVTMAFYAPSSQPPDWGRTSLRRRAEALPRVRVVDDIDAREAILFGAANSGHVVVYGPGGEARFGGGITAARGHEGDNLGADCVLDALRGAAPAVRVTPTFGCEIAPPAGTAACPRCEQETGR